MPPKGKQPEPAKKKATVDDKTFGMKNKKGATAQKQIAQLQAQAKSNKSAEEKRKEALKEQLPFGVDPKTVVCEFFRKGTCEKGKKCKFSHDLEVGRKAEKLRKVVLSKHGNPRTTTDKVCKYFIQAVEDGKYGWFWTCPNGGDKCMYRHSLPAGFVLKTKEQRAAEKALMDKSPLKTLTLEDFLESERHKLTGTLTPVTEETFAKWKKERMDKKQAEAEALKAKEATGPTNIPHHTPNAPILSRHQRLFLLTLAVFPVVGYAALELRQQRLRRTMAETPPTDLDMTPGPATEAVVPPSGGKRVLALAKGKNKGMLTRKEMRDDLRAMGISM
ncbi:hypothetical protein DV735_g19, partial [Chaetothyriales sp. CBS 134920]